MEMTYVTHYHTFFIEETPTKKPIYRPLASTVDQVKLCPDWMTDKYKDRQYCLGIVEWYKTYYNEINYLFNRFIRIFTKKKIFFYTDIKTIQRNFVQFLYHKNCIEIYEYW
jgi:hypothetical protein